MIFWFALPFYLIQFILSPEIVHTLPSNRLVFQDNWSNRVAHYLAGLLALIGFKLCLFNHADYSKVSAENHHPIGLVDKDSNNQEENNSNYQGFEGGSPSEDHTACWGGLAIGVIRLITRWLGSSQSLNLNRDCISVGNSKLLEFKFNWLSWSLKKPGGRRSGTGTERRTREIMMPFRWM